MRIARLSPIALACALLSSNAFSATPSFLPPEEMVKETLDAFPGVLAAEANIQSAQSEATRLRKGAHEATLSGSYISRSIDGLGAYDEYDMTVSRGVRLPGKARLDKLSGSLGVDVAENQAEDARHEAALILKDAWLSWLSAVEIAAIDAEGAQSFKSAFIAVEKRRNVKAASDMEVAMARAEYEQAEARAAMSAAEAASARAIIERTFPELSMPAAPLNLPAPEPLLNSDELEALTLERSHELQIYRKEAERLDAVAKRARLDRFADPTVGVRGFSERGGEETGIGVVFSVPFGSGARRATAARDRSTAEASRYSAIRFEREFKARTQANILAADGAFTAWRAASAASASSEEAVSKMRRGFSLGAKSLAELLLAEQRHLDIKRTEAESRFAAHLAHLQVLIDAHEIWIVHHHDDEGEEDASG
ncbi:MAG TPA: TolC family protein [Parvularculaceae bacterium]|nr:TolC family protein [Amphiplicatus sp.]HOP19479.1 TolC family protein [Amphiplicatus sp.]HPE30558.1 TolC family protein [Parvularculaceae bacterium]HRX38153.1 TolC family protein [Parvularculaceae bacterium]